MAGKSSKRSIIDDLWAGAVIVQKGGEPAGDGQSMAGRASGEESGSGSDSGSGSGSDGAAGSGGDDGRDELLAGLVEFDPADFVGSEPAPAPVRNDRPAQVGADGNTSAGGSIFGDYGDGNGSAGTDRRSDPATSRKRNETRAKNQKVSSTVDFTQTLLIGIHNMLAGALKSDVWKISDAEAVKLAEAAAQVQAEYNLQLTPKQAAWANLGVVAGSVYGSRLLVHNGLKKMKAEAAKARAQPAAEAAPVDPFPGAAPAFATPDPEPGKPWRDGFGMVPNATTPSQLLPPGMRGASI